jgi:hypothetical protein
MGKGKKQLRIRPTKQFIELLTAKDTPGMPLTEWKARQDRKMGRA